MLPNKIMTTTMVVLASSLAALTCGGLANGQAHGEGGGIEKRVVEGNAVANAAPEKKRVYTPEEVMREVGEAVRAATFDAESMMTVGFKVRLVKGTPEIRSGDKSWVIGHGPADIGLHPQDRVDWAQIQFSAILILLYPLCALLEPP